MCHLPKQEKLGKEQVVGDQELPLTLLSLRSP